jgi:hypothetical protein
MLPYLYGTQVFSLTLASICVAHMSANNVEDEDEGKGCKAKGDIDEE